MSDIAPMTSEKFDEGLNEEALAGLQGHRTQYTALIQLSKSYRRPDLAAIFEQLRKSVDEAMHLIEGLSDAPTEKN